MFKPVVCPHCHSPIDPTALDTARSSAGEWRICPACDEPLLFQPREPKDPNGQTQTTRQRVAELALATD